MLGCIVGLPSVEATDVTQLDPRNVPFPEFRMASTRGVAGCQPSEAREAVPPPAVAGRFCRHNRGGRKWPPQVCQRNRVYHRHAANILRLVSISISRGFPASESAFKPPAA